MSSCAVPEAVKDAGEAPLRVYSPPSMRPDSVPVSVPVAVKVAKEGYVICSPKNQEGLALALEAEKSPAGKNP